MAYDVTYYMFIFIIFIDDFFFNSDFNIYFQDLVDFGQILYQSIL